MLSYLFNNSGHKVLVICIFLKDFNKYQYNRVLTYHNLKPEELLAKVGSVVAIDVGMYNI